MTGSHLKLSASFRYYVRHTSSQAETGPHQLNRSVLSSQLRIRFVVVLTRLLTWTVQCRREKQSIPPRNIYFEIAKPPASGTFTLKITQPVFKIY